MSLTLGLTAICIHLFFIVANAAVVGRAAAANPTATLASGSVIGTITTVSGTPTASVKAYLGLPYAQSPPLRFAPPKPLAAWSQPIVAQAVAPACIQQFQLATGLTVTQARTKQYFNNPAGPTPPESEDCLYLNVFAPVAASSTNQKAVMFWLFGGNLAFGEGSLNFYNGSRLALENDVVVVTINYRTNIFGFSNSPEIPFGQQNAGYLDQRLALSFVHDNIAAFGGDPTRVTLFGQSAGAYSVKQILANPPSPLPFTAAILESSGLGLSGTSNYSYQQVVNNFKCNSAPSPIACLRNVAATDIKAYIENQSLTFSPVNNDGTQMNDVRPSIDSGKFAHVPIIIGANPNEGRIFAAILGLDTPNNTVNDIPVSDLAAFFHTNTTFVNNLLVAAGPLYTNTPANSGYLLVSQVITDLIYTCPTMLLSNYLTSHGYKAYRYTYSGVFPDVGFFDNPGAYHTAEISSVFGTYPVDSYGSPTNTQIALSQTVRSAWAGLTKNPSGGAGWPAVGTNGGLELENFGANNGSTAVLQQTSSQDLSCVVYAPLDPLIGFSY